MMKEDRDGGAYARRSIRALGLAAAAALALIATPQGGRAQEGYRSHDALTSAIRSLVNASDAASVRSIGESREGREVWMITLASPGGTPVEDRPGVIVVGTLEGDHLVGGEIAVGAARWLLEQNGANEEVTRLLTERVVYVVPRLNPDGAEANVERPVWGRRGNAWEEDDDNDARMAEDGPNDLNGDGVITVMRVADRSGGLIPHPDDPRLMKKADPVEGESGTHTLYIEGTDDDGDGFIAEDGPGGVDLNRNFQHEYPYYEADAGRNMVSEPESRAIMDFMVAHRNIGAILTFGHTDNLVEAPNGQGRLAAPRTISLLEWARASNDGVHEVGVFGGQTNFGNLSQRGAQLGRDNDPGSGRRPATTVNSQDQPYFRAVSEAYREITGIERTGYHRAPAGAFFEWGYYQYGVPSFSTQGWAIAEAEGESFDQRLLNALDSAGIDAFVAWQPFTHPTLGEVEIGGFRPGEVVNPPPAEIGALGASHGEFIARLGGMLPRVRFVAAGAEEIGGGLWKIETTIENAGYFPTSLAHGQTAGAVNATLVQIQVDPDAIVSGDDKTARNNRLDGSGATASFSWVVRANAGETIEITSRAEKGGLDSITVTLR
ncbi:MAG: M14 family metallopeptidase [Longimicrobiales bacterium]|nr:M14 family metallopeptidase [Longimicrobiales bacterium]